MKRLNEVETVEDIAHNERPSSARISVAREGLYKLSVADTRVATHETVADLECIYKELF